MASLDKKDKIIKAALEIMCVQGAAFLKLNEVAKKAKVPPPLIHYYFKDIEDLHYEVILKVLESLKEQSLKDSQNQNDSIKSMKSYIRGTFVWAKQNPGLMSLWMYFYYLSSFSPRFQDLNTQIRNQGRERIALMVYQGIQKKHYQFEDTTNVFELAEEIQAILTGQVILFATEKSDFKMENCLEICTQRIFAILGT